MCSRLLSLRTGLGVVSRLHSTSSTPTLARHLSSVSNTNWKEDRGQNQHVVIAASNPHRLATEMLLRASPFQVAVAVNEAFDRLGAVLASSGKMPKGFEKFYKDRKPSAGSKSSEKSSEGESKADKPSPSPSGGSPKTKDKPPSFYWSSERPSSGGAGGGKKGPGGGGFSDADKQRLMTAAGFTAIALSIMFGLSQLEYREITWKEFVNNYLSRGVVEKLVVVNGKWVQVDMGPSGTGEKLWFTIGSVDTFEKNLENTQLEWQLESSKYNLEMYYHQVHTSTDSFRLSGLFPWFTRPSMNCQIW